MEHVYGFVDVIQKDVSEKVDVLAETIKRIFTQVDIYRNCDEIIPPDSRTPLADRRMCYLHQRIY
jgi:hypothetical protein